MHKSKLRWITLAVCMALTPLIGEAAGLGRLTVISGLGEPLNAEIELISTSPEELSSLTASIAPEEAYAVQGIERTSVQNAIKIDVDKKPGGTPVLKLSTRQPVSDPFLDMLIQVDWATGRLLREYTLLLDPPGYDGQPSTNTSAAPTVEQSAVPEASMPAPAESGNPADAATQTTDNLITQPASTEHKTVSGDTLNRIAREMQVEGISLEQMLVGLYRANKDAFVDDNMNRLKVGEIIRAPEPEALQAIGQREALNEIHVQTADWNAYRNRLAGIVADSAPAEEDVSNQSTSGKLTAPAEDRAAPPGNAAQDVVKLSKSDTSANTAKNSQDKLNALQEEVIARENSLKEANERTAALEKQIQDMQQLLAIKNQALADMQKGAADQNATPEQPAQAPAPAATDNNSAAAVPPAAKPDKPAAAKPKAAKPAAKKTVAAPAATPASNGLLDDLLQNQLVILIAAGALVLLGGVWLLLRNKRRRELDSFEKGILTSGGLKANTVFGNTSGDTVDTGDTSFLTDFSQSTGGMIDTHDVDPIAEAEVYMAYGRDAQAEEILKDAIAKEPKRYELHLKLLEIFAARNDVSSFETIAGELYSTLGASDPNWVKVAEIGRKLEPDNPLYTTATAAAATAVTASAASAEPATPAEPKVTSDKLASDLADAEVIGATDLDFSLNTDEPADAGKVAAPAESNALLDLDQKTVPTAYTEEAAPEADLSKTVTVMDETQDKSLDFSLDFPEPLATNTVQLDVADFGHTVSENDLPAFDVPALAVDTSSAEAVDETQQNLPEISFDMPETIAENEKPMAEVQDLPSLEFTSFDEIKTQDTELNTEPVEEKIVFEALPDQPGDVNFDFDMSSGPADSDTPVSINQVPEMDLSGINLDLGDSGDADKAALSGESAEVNTKIDLVSAYIDMDDIEGARELLEEVLKEGGTNQRQYAQKLLDSLA